MKNMQKLMVRLSSQTGWLLVVLYFLLLPAVVASFVLKGWWVALLYMTCIFAVLYFRVWGKGLREQHIREAPMPRFLKTKLLKTYPHLTAKDADLVERGLRQFFVACARSNKSFVAMPSKAVDALWHEFILHTKAYEAWCSMALGYFLHHTPAAALGKKAKNNDGLRRAWYWACKDEAIDPKAPSRLPLLFALDLKLAIEGGFTYVPDCADIARKSAAGGSGGDTYCGSDFSSGSYSSESSSSGDFGGADASSGSDGGGDGGGGGCGGGGD
jgi:hypothetical protein